jgi:hypothetical protein
MPKLPDPPKDGISKTKLLLGAGALLLFIVGVRKSWQRPEDELPPPCGRDRDER